jgi:hypothetical protein
LAQLFGVAVVTVAKNAAAMDGALRGVSACLYERPREIGDNTAQLVEFQFKECIDQGGAMGGK